MARMIICDRCGERKPKVSSSKGICSNCYANLYKVATKGMIKETKTNTIIICDICGKRKPKVSSSKGICGKCYSKFYKEAMCPNTGITTKNKKCTVYLGCVVAEAVLVKVFKNVTRMPVNNPGYDFICGRGFKVDVKSSCHNIKYDFWSFGINYNTIADYFLCLAFDNRESLNPLYAWLIPQKELIGTRLLCIYRSKMEMWDKYRIPLDKIVECCDLMKEK